MCRHRSILIFWGAQKLEKIVWSIFFEISTLHFYQHEDVQVIFKDATKIQNGR